MRTRLGEPDGMCGYEWTETDSWLAPGSKTYLDLPSLIEPPEYSIVICADDDEYAGRNKVLQKVCPFLPSAPDSCLSRPSHANSLSAQAVCAQVS